MVYGLALTKKIAAMKLKYCLPALLCLYLQVFIPAAQAQVQVIRQSSQPVTQDTGPVIGLTLAGSARRQLSKYGDKPVLLCFMAVHCGASLKQLPRLYAIQQQLGQKIQVLLISSEDSAEVAAALQENPAVAGIQLPLIAADTLFSRLFPHRLVPHFVWLNKNRQVVQVTGSYEVTAPNLLAISRGETLQLPQKKDLLDFSPAQPVMLKDTAIIAGSALQGRLAGAGSIIGIYPGNGCKRYLAVNQTLSGLYEGITGLSANAVIPETADTVIWRQQPAEAWESAHLYTYEMKAPVATSLSRLHRLVKEDLDRYFSLQTTFENRELTAWALVLNKNSGMPSFAAKSALPFLLIEQNNTVWIIQDVTPADMVNAMNNAAGTGGPLFLDETGSDLPLNMRLGVDDINNISKLQQQLAPYGLTLEKRQVTRRVLIIRDKNNAASAATGQATPVVQQNTIVNKQPYLPAQGSSVFHYTHY